MISAVLQLPEETYGLFLLPSKIFGTGGHHLLSPRLVLKSCTVHNGQYILQTLLIHLFLVHGLKVDVICVFIQTHCLLKPAETLLYNQESTSTSVREQTCFSSCRWLHSFYLLLFFSPPLTAAVCFLVMHQEIKSKSNTISGLTSRRFNLKTNSLCFLP